MSLRDELVEMIRAGIDGQPRNSQRLPGPSELGHPCQRRTGHKLAGTPEANERGTAWKPFVGTALHAQFEQIIARQPDRFLTERKVMVGQVDGTDIWGSCDLFDLATGTVVDWKFTTRNMIREKYRPHGPGEQYQRQAHLYGRGFQLAGHDVREVAVFFWTRDGEFTDSHWWSEPYAAWIAEDTLAAATTTAHLLRDLGPAALPLLPTADAHCPFCPWFQPGATDLTRACPGDPGREVRPDRTASLISKGARTP